MLRREMTTTHHAPSSESRPVAVRRYVRPVAREIHPLTAHPTNASAPTRTPNPTAAGKHRLTAPLATHR
jgi:hypothetical protein